MLIQAKMGFVGATKMDPSHKRKPASVQRNSHPPHPMMKPRASSSSVASLTLLIFLVLQSTWAASNAQPVVYGEEEGTVSVSSPLSTTSSRRTSNNSRLRPSPQYGEKDTEGDKPLRCLLVAAVTEYHPTLGTHHDVAHGSAPSPEDLDWKCLLIHPTNNGVQDDGRRNNDRRIIHVRGLESWIQNAITRGEDGQANRKTKEKGRFLRAPGNGKAATGNSNHKRNPAISSTVQIGVRSGETELVISTDGGEGQRGRGLQIEGDTLHLRPRSADAYQHDGDGNISDGIDFVDRFTGVSLLQQFREQQQQRQRSANQNGDIVPATDSRIDSDFGNHRRRLKRKYIGTQSTLVVRATIGTDDAKTLSQAVFGSPFKFFGPLGNVEDGHGADGWHVSGPSGNDEEGHGTDGWNFFGSSGNVSAVDGEDDWNLRSGIAGCSRGQLDMKPATWPLTPDEGNGTTVIGANLIELGVLTVDIGSTVPADRNNAMTAMWYAAEDLLGLDGVDGRYLETTFDHVLFCIPGTSEGWVAQAFINHAFSMYNGDWCKIPSAQMHEIGHNFNLDHAGKEGEEYGDTTGVMGSSGGDEKGPKVCFNPANSYLLGWYRRQQLDWDPLTQGSLATRVVGVVDYNPDNTDQYTNVVVRLGPANDESGYFIGYNKAEGPNAGTPQGANQVTIIQYGGLTSDGMATKTGLVALLSEGGEHRIEKFRSGTAEKVVIVRWRGWSNNAPVVEVSVAGGPPPPALSAVPSAPVVAAEGARLHTQTLSSGSLRNGIQPVQKKCVKWVPKDGTSFKCLDWEP